MGKEISDIRYQISGNEKQGMAFRRGNRSPVSSDASSDGKANPRPAISDRTPFGANEKRGSRTCRADLKIGYYTKPSPGAARRYSGDVVTFIKSWR